MAAQSKTKTKKTTKPAESQELKGVGDQISARSQIVTRCEPNFDCTWNYTTTLGPSTCVGDTTCDIVTCRRGHICYSHRCGDVDVGPMLARAHRGDDRAREYMMSLARSLGEFLDREDEKA